MNNKDNGVCRDTDTKKTPKILLKKIKRLLQVREQEPKGSRNKPDRKMVIER